MKLLLDTHILLWAGEGDPRLPAAARAYIENDQCELFFSIASIWEIVIKRGKDYKNFEVEPSLFRRNLLDNGYAELAVTSEHAFTVGSLPPIHKDPFDRMLIAQATADGLLFLTVDPVVARYPGPIQKL